MSSAACRKYRPGSPYRAETITPRTEDCLTTSYVILVYWPSTGLKLTGVKSWLFATILTASGLEYPSPHPLSLPLALLFQALVALNHESAWAFWATIRQLHN